jgi:hypothetical protein
VGLLDVWLCPCALHANQSARDVLRVCRPEMKFSGLDELLARINTDIGIAKSQLDLPQWQAYKQDAFLE